MPELAACDMAEFFGADGPLAQRLPGYELRPSQVRDGRGRQARLQDASVAP